MIDFDTDKYYYSEKKVDEVVNFITKRCKHVYGDLSGQPLIPADFWVDDIIAPAFGVLKKSDNKRKFKTVYLEIGKGNAKSTMGAALALNMMIMDRPDGAQVFGAAGDRAQAGIIFETAKNMVIMDDKLSKRCRPFQHSIVKNNSSSFYKVLSAEAGTKHGLIWSGVVFDEVHVQQKRDLWDTITAGAMKITDSLLFGFTTAGYDKQSICYEQHRRSEKIKKGIIIEDSFLGVIYAADEEDDISMEETWKKANPGLGTIITVENLATEYNKVQTTPSYENTFRRLHLNQWTDSYEGWISDILWQKCGLREDDTDTADLPSYGGLDCASTTDFNCYVNITPILKPGEQPFYYETTDEGEKIFKVDLDAIDQIIVKMKSWIPKDMIDIRVKKENIDYYTWVKNGYITEIPGSAADPSFIINDIREDLKISTTMGISYDRKFASPIVLALEDMVSMNAFDQSMVNFTFPTKQLEYFVIKEIINHLNNPVLRWMMSNVQIYRSMDGKDNMMVHKGKSQDKVDGVVALIMAIGEWLSSEMQGDGKSIYETRGVVTL